MKTIRIIFSVAALALSGITLAQTLAQTQPLAQNSEAVLYYSSFYNLASNRMEHQVNPFPARNASGDNFEAPLISRTFFDPVEIDEDIEDWMTRPFDISIYEEEIEVEPWMLSPFKCNYYEPDLVVEEWMTKPFEIETGLDGDIEVEPWMTSPFVID